jgi:hypothetical protein
MLQDFFPPIFANHFSVLKQAAMSTPPFIRPYRKSRVKPHEVAGSKVESLTVSNTGLILSYCDTAPNNNSAVEEEHISQTLEDWDRPVITHQEVQRLKRKSTRTSHFVAGSPNAITQRKCEVKFKLKQKSPSTGYYYRCKRTPETFHETLQQLNSMSPAAIKDGSKEGPSPRKLDLDDIGDRQKRKFAKGDRARNKVGKKPALKGRKKAPPTSAVMDVTEYETSAVEGDFPKSQLVAIKLEPGVTVTKKTRTKYKKRRKPGVAASPAGPKRTSRRPWKWFPCEECVSCMRERDCGKCGQCRNGEVGICILRQCITPVRHDDVTPKRLISDDDESLEGMDSDLSDLEWEEAFPPEEFGSLTRKDLLKRWADEKNAGKKIAQELPAATLDMPTVCI